MDQKPYLPSKITSPSTTQRGLAAEDRAFEFLSQKGYRLIVKNFRWKRGEADLIMMAQDKTLVLIEVRSSASASSWLRFSVTPRKVFHLQQTLDYFVRKRPLLAHLPRRIEFLWIEGNKIEHWTRPF